MARKRKGELKSGNIRVQTYDYTDAAGKKHYKSFTAPTRSEAEAMVTRWKQSRSTAAHGLTVSEAVGKYIDLKRPVLSPSTVRGYISYHRNHLGPETQIGKTQLLRVNQVVIQSYISDLAAHTSPKTCANVVGLLTATLSMYVPDLRYRTTLPAKVKPVTNTPTDEDLAKIISSADEDMRIAIYLGAFGPLRRGEICALTDKDVDQERGTVTVSKSMVQTETGKWVIKETPKTYSSFRTITLPPFVMEALKGRKGMIFPHTPRYITDRFRRITMEAGIETHLRFHDTRSYAASIMLAINVPDLYGMKRGGWATPYVMKKHYQDVIDLEERKQTKKILEYFDKHFRSV